MLRRALAAELSITGQREWSIFKVVDTFSPKSGDLVLPLAPPDESADAFIRVLPASFAQDLFIAAKAQDVDLTVDEFSGALSGVGARLNYGCPAGSHANNTQKAAFLRSLHLEEFALAISCALGRETGWQRFLSLYRAPLTKAAIGITGSAALGSELADSLYSELYGLREVDGERRSPLATYSGRGSLLGWLRTTLAQRHVDLYRRSRRETPLDAVDAAAPEQKASPVPAELTQLAQAVTRTLQALPPGDRFLLASYFLDRRTLLQIGRFLRVHEATISRRLKRLVTEVRKQLFSNLQAGGLSKQAVERLLGSDPRDIEINLRKLLQTSPGATFSDQADGS